MTIQSMPAKPVTPNPYADYCVHCGARGVTKSQECSFCNARGWYPVTLGRNSVTALHRHRYARDKVVVFVSGKTDSSYAWTIGRQCQNKYGTYATYLNNINLLELILSDEEVVFVRIFPRNRPPAVGLVNFSTHTLLEEPTISPVNEDIMAILLANQRNIMVSDARHQIQYLNRQVEDAKEALALCLPHGNESKLLLSEYDLACQVLLAERLLIRYWRFIDPDNLVETFHDIMQRVSRSDVPRLTRSRRYLVSRMTQLAQAMGIAL